jgi:hypothetical protein
VTVDCADPVALANFWAAVTGYEQHPENGVEPEDDSCYRSAVRAVAVVVTERHERNGRHRLTGTGPQ